MKHIQEVSMPTPLKFGETKTTLPSRVSPPQQKTATTQELLGDARELIILHLEEQYRLRLTRNGKLILTK